MPQYPVSAPGGASPFNWQSLIGPALGIAGGVLGTKAANQPEQWRQKIIESEIARRNMFQGFAAPGMFKALGYSPADVQSHMAQMGGPAASTGGYGVTPGGASTTQKILGGAGSAAGIAGAVGKIAPHFASKLGIGALGGPVGLGIGAALTGAQILGGQIGKGRRAANDFVRGVENPFGQDLAQISALAKTDPQAAAQMLREKYGNYRAAAQQEMGAGGNRAKTAQQSLGNPALQQTVQQLAAQLGVRL